MRGSLLKPALWPSLSSLILSSRPILWSLNPNMRQRVKKKWSVDRSGGPQLLLTELLVKRLVKHSYPCQTKIDDYGRAVIAPHMSGGFLPRSFFDIANSALRCFIYELGVQARLYWGFSYWPYVDLVGPHHINSRGDIVRGFPKENLSDDSTPI